MADIINITLISPYKPRIAQVIRLNNLNHKVYAVYQRIPCKSGLVIEAAKMNIYEYLNAREILSHVTFQVLPKLMENLSTVDVLWYLSCRLKECTPNWSGMMHLIYDIDKRQHPRKSSVVFLPIIDMAPSDKTCILSILTYLANLAHSHHVPAILTFDQPLFWKRQKSSVLHVMLLHWLMS